MHTTSIHRARAWLYLAGSASPSIFSLCCEENGSEITSEELILGEAPQALRGDPWFAAAYESLHGARGRRWGYGARGLYDARPFVVLAWAWSRVLVAAQGAMVASAKGYERNALRTLMERDAHLHDDRFAGGS